MIKICLALRDVKAELFMQPFFVPTVGVAYRNLIDEVARGGDENPLAKHPGDYEVWQLGTYDDETGELVPSQAKLVDVSSLVISPRELSAMNS